MSTYITKLEATGSGPRVAVKDIIDIEGVPTTAGCRALADTARPAATDAACLAGARAADARFVGKTNLHELAMLPLGTNSWFGTPVNPLDPDLIPGGSSSGSAVAVATGEADVALGTDTGGSIRVPSACCGTAGLKTTYGRIPLAGVYPLAPSLDSVGPMSSTIAGLTLGMQLLEPGFTPAPSAATTVGRIRTAGHPEIEAAIDAALREAGFEVVSIDWEGLATGAQAFMGIYFAEMWETDGHLAQENPDSIGVDVATALALAEGAREGLATALEAAEATRRSTMQLLDRCEILALPTLPIFPPRLDAITPDTLFGICTDITAHLVAFNVAGVPCTAQPVPTASGGLPASLQLVGRPNSEELLLTTAQQVESAVASG